MHLCYQKTVSYPKKKKLYFYIEDIISQDWDKRMTIKITLEWDHARDTVF